MAYNPQNPNGQATMAASAPVVVASNQSAIPIIQTSSATVGGLTPATGSSVGGSTAILITGSPSQVYGWYFYNPNTIAAYISFYNLSSGIIVGSTSPFYVLVVPPVSGANVFGVGVTHGTAISIGISQGRSLGTAMSTAVDYNIFYK
jgi:hypothetical protein